MNNQGYVKPSKEFLNAKKHLRTNQMDFVAYYRLRMIIQRAHQHPTSELTQHDRDKISYADAFKQIRAVEKKFDYVETKVNKINQLNLTLITNLENVLYSKGVINKADKKAIIKLTERGMKLHGK